MKRNISRENLYWKGYIIGLLTYLLGFIIGKYT